MTEEFESRLRAGVRELAQQGERAPAPVEAITGRARARRRGRVGVIAGTGIAAGVAAALVLPGMLASGPTDPGPARPTSAPPPALVDVVPVGASGAGMLVAQIDPVGAAEIGIPGVLLIEDGCVILRSTMDSSTVGAVIFPPGTTATTTSDENIEIQYESGRSFTVGNEFTATSTHYPEELDTAALTAAVRGTACEGWTSFITAEMDWMG